MQHDDVPITRVENPDDRGDDGRWTEQAQKHHNAAKRAPQPRTEDNRKIDCVWTRQELRDGKGLVELIGGHPTMFFDD